MSDFRAQLGLALKRQRQRRTLTQPQLAELADLSVRHVADVEGGKKNYTMETLSRLAAALDWDPLVNFTVHDTPNRVAMRAAHVQMRGFKRKLEATVERLKALHTQFVSRGASTQSPAPVESMPVRAAKPLAKARKRPASRSKSSRRSK